MDQHPTFKHQLFLAAPVLIVEDEPAVTQRLCALLLGMGYEATSLLWARNVAEARKIYASEAISLALIDLGLPDGSGQQVIEELRACDASMKILVISAWSTEDAILGALRAGATGYLLKERDDLELTLGIASTLRGGAPIDPFIAKRLLHEFSLMTSPASSTSNSSEAVSARVTVTQREQQILSMVAQGMTNREIAERLALSKHTVECHIKNIYQKMAVSSRTKAILLARQHGLIE
ncbi:MAG: response regulator transcription factor [Comamonas sp.]|jgi:DNA-binding NarL/FixJ family response regulator|nr:response regulator transcription factor [Comamonas sp.]